MNCEKRTNALTDGGYIIVNRNIAHDIGINAAILYGELCEEHDYWLDQGKLKDGEWFYSTIENIEQMANLKRTAQENALKILVDKNYVETYVGGMPPKRYFKIPYLSPTNKSICMKPTNQNVGDQQINLHETNKSICMSPTTNNNNINNNKDTNNKYSAPQGKDLAKERWMRHKAVQQACDEFFNSP